MYKIKMILISILIITIVVTIFLKTYGVGYSVITIEDTQIKNSTYVVNNSWVIKDNPFYNAYNKKEIYYKLKIHTGFECVIKHIGIIEYNIIDIKICTQK